ncbi:MAG: NlpC/P60 family protein [Fibrobacter sp.]|nr:NlpC/P60 family protein [Fibrobacter sp.]
MHLLLILCLGLMACTFPVRTGYDRSIGDYKPASQATSAATSAQPKASESEQKTEQAAKQATTATNSNLAKPDSLQKQAKTNSNAKVREAAKQKEIARAAPKKRSSLEDVVKPWMGTKYKLGGTSKSGIDCSGYVMQIYKEYYGIALDHHAETIYKDGRGSSVGRGSLKEGDLIFFGDFWGISHVGIYLNGDRFTHASTSRGVMISPMNDKYWSPKYKGARRFK